MPSRSTTSNHIRCYSPSFINAEVPSWTTLNTSPGDAPSGDARRRRSILSSDMIGHRPRPSPADLQSTLRRTPCRTHTTPTSLKRGDSNGTKPRTPPITKNQCFFLYYYGLLAWRRPRPPSRHTQRPRERRVKEKRRKKELVSDRYVLLCWIGLASRLSVSPPDQGYMQREKKRRKACSCP